MLQTVIKRRSSSHEPGKRDRENTVNVVQPDQTDLFPVNRPISVSQKKHTQYDEERQGVRTAEPMDALGNRIDRNNLFQQVLFAYPADRGHFYPPLADRVFAVNGYFSHHQFIIPADRN